MPNRMRQYMEHAVNRVGHWLYVKLLPYPRVRLRLSRINGILKVFKNPQAVVAGTQAHASRPVTARRTEDALRPGGLKTPQEMHVAMIVDEFTFNSFRFECQAYPLEPDNWCEVFAQTPIDLFFCESAWSGTDSQSRPWQGQVYASVHTTRENRGVLLEILAYCKSRRIPTVFWNKEDPGHFDDRVHDFVKTAVLFDHVFTTSVECVERYKREYGHKSVHLLMFASQPRLFNPIERYDRTDEVVFAGSWYRQHQDRCREMSAIFDGILASSHPLKIFDRQSDNPDPNHRYPKKYRAYTCPRLAHDAMDEAYKSSEYALNINTITDSETMFARRVFELMACNTLVLSNRSPGMARLFGDGVVFVDGAAPIDLDGAEEKRETCLEEVLARHAYGQRFAQMLKDIGVAFAEEQPLVTLSYCVADVGEADAAVRHFHRMDWPNKRCVLHVDAGSSPGKPGLPGALQSVYIKHNRGLVTVCATGYVPDTIEDAHAHGQGYRIDATCAMDCGFIRRAMAHAAYLDGKTPIAAWVDNASDAGVSGQAYGGGKYRFTLMKQGKDILIPVGMRNRLESMVSADDALVETYMI